MSNEYARVFGVLVHRQKLLIILCVFLALIIVPLSLLLFSYNAPVALYARSHSGQDSMVCTTELCRLKSSYRLLFANYSVDPCTNVYDFSCGNFDQFFDHNAHTYSLSGYLHDYKTNMLHVMLYSGSRNYVPFTDQMSRVSSELYTICVDTISDRFDDIYILENLINDVGGSNLFVKWNDDVEQSWNFTRILYKLSEYNFSPFFVVYYHFNRFHVKPASFFEPFDNEKWISIISKSILSRYLFQTCNYECVKKSYNNYLDIADALKHKRHFTGNKSEIKFDLERFIFDNLGEKIFKLLDKDDEFIQTHILINGIISNFPLEKLQHFIFWSFVYIYQDFFGASYNSLDTQSIRIYCRLFLNRIFPMFDNFFFMKQSTESSAIRFIQSFVKLLNSKFQERIDNRSLHSDLFIPEIVHYIEVAETYTKLNDALAAEYEHIGLNEHFNLTFILEIMKHRMDVMVNTNTYLSASYLTLFNDISFDNHIMDANYECIGSNNSRKCILLALHSSFESYAQLPSSEIYGNLMFYLLSVLIKETMNVLPNFLASMNVTNYWCIQQPISDVDRPILVALELSLLIYKDVVSEKHGLDASSKRVLPDTSRLQYYQQNKDMGHMLNFFLSLLHGICGLVSIPDIYHSFFLSLDDFSSAFKCNKISFC